MIGGWPESALLSEIIRRLVLVITTCGVWFAIVLLFLRLARITNPRIRYLFLFIPLLKSVLALVNGEPFVADFNGVFIVTTQMFNPGALLPTIPDLIPRPIKGLPEMLTENIVIVLLLAAAFFIWRLTGFIQFMKMIQTARPLDRQEHAPVYAVLDRLAAEARTRPPRLVHLDLREAPFTVGFLSPIVAVSSAVLQVLEPKELEAVLAHELAHIVRRDYLYHWGIVLLRDLLFFNPLTHVIYARLSFERERACDDYGSKLSERLQLARSLVKLAEAKTVAPSVAAVRSFAPQTFVNKRESYLSKRVNELLVPAEQHQPGRPGRAMLGLTALFLLALQLHLIIMASGSPVFLF